MGKSSHISRFTENSLRLIYGIGHFNFSTDLDANYLPMIAGYFDVEKWTDALSKNGLSAKEIQKLVGGNAKRVLSGLLK